MAPAADTLVLHPDRCFDPEPSVRRAARELYDETRDLPIISPHGHVDARILAEDSAFTDPASLLVTADHYVTRMLYSQGVALAGDPRETWQRFAEHYHLFNGTPTGFWLDHEMFDLFGVRTRLNANSASRIYDQIAERLRAPEYRPRALYDRFKIEVLATTDAATDSLQHHQAIRNSGWKGRIIPTFRPDALFAIATAEWPEVLRGLGAWGSGPVRDYSGFVAALEERREFFKAHGATATDHGVADPFTEMLAPDEAEQIFARALAASASADDQRRFTAHMLIEMARMSVADGLVMQVHAGAMRDHNANLFEALGPDQGGDIPITVEFTRNLHALLNAYGNDPRFTLILFTLDESTYSRELAPLAGHYPAVRLGPPWWFHDSMQGMRRYREQTSETAGIWNTAGFNDDTRAFCSIPARHDLSRRMDANYLAGLVARHVVDIADARVMARAMAYDLAREAYRLSALF